MASVVCALLVTAGLLYLLGVEPKDITAVLLSPFRRKRALKRRLDAIAGKKPNFIQHRFYAARQMLDASGMGRPAGGYKWLSCILSALGLTLGLAINSPLAALVLAIGLAALLPLALLYIRTGEYVRALNEKLESAIGTVGNAYVQSGDLISAVQGSLNLLPAPLNGIFGRFLVEATLIDADVVKAITNMRDKVDNRYWKDWCDVLIQCQADRQLRFALPGIAQRLGETRRVQMEVDTKNRKHFGEYILTVLIVLGSIPLMGAMLPDWYGMLMHTVPGKITLAAVLFAILATSVWVAKLSRPVDAGGGTR